MGPALLTPTVLAMSESILNADTMPLLAPCCKAHTGSSEDATQHDSSRCELDSPRDCKSDQKGTIGYMLLEIKKGLNERRRCIG